MINIRGPICDEFRKSVNDASVQDVEISKYNVFNLIGIWSLLKELLDLGSDRKSEILIKKGN